MTRQDILIIPMYIPQVYIIALNIMMFRGVFKHVQQNEFSFMGVWLPIGFFVNVACLWLPLSFDLGEAMSI